MDAIKTIGYPRAFKQKEEQGFRAVKRMNYLERLCIACFAFLGTNSFAYEIMIESEATKDLGYGEWVVKTDGEFDLMQKLVHSGNTVFDVGANVGEWSLHALELGRPIRLYAFEPLPLIFTDLQQKLSNYSNVQTINLALSNNIGRANFCYYDETYEFSGLSSFYVREVLKADHQPPKIIEVEQDTLTHFCLNHNIDKIDFLKIDAEGAEWIILQGAAELIKQSKITAIQFEYGGCYIDANTRLEDIFNFLSQQEYLIFRIIPNGLIQITEWSPHLENFIISNYVAIKKGETSNLLGESWKSSQDF